MNRFKLASLITLLLTVSCVQAASVNASAMVANDSTVAANAFRNAGSPQISQYHESTLYAGSGSTPVLPANYRDGASILNDDDGSYTADKGCVSNCSKVVSITKAQHDAMKDCGYADVMASSGLNPSVLSERIRHCAMMNGAVATWNGAENGNTGEASWVLVARSVEVVKTLPYNKEVWQDQRTGLLWSSRETAYDPTNVLPNWCQSVGNNDVADSTCKTNTNKSYCAEMMFPVATAATKGFYFDDYASGTYAKAKGMMGLKSAPSVRWRVPTRADYMQADIDGVRNVLPDMGFDVANEWTATVNGVTKTNAFAFSNPDGAYVTNLRSVSNSAYTVRCVGR